MSQNYNIEESIVELEVMDTLEENLANETAAEIEIEMFNEDADIQELASEIEAKCMFEDEQANESLVDEIVQEFAI